MGVSSQCPIHKVSLNSQDPDIAKEIRAPSKLTMKRMLTSAVLHPPFFPTKPKSLL